MTDRLPLIRLGWLRALLFFIASFITSQIFAGIGMVVALLISGFDISTLSNQDAIIDELNKINFLLLLKIIEFFALMFCLWLFMKFIDRKPLMSLGLKYEGFQQDFKFGLILGAGLIAIGFFSLFILGYVRVESFSFPFLDIVLYFILFVVVAFHEEIMLRGYILRSLMESMNRYLALAISSLIFMTVHLLNPNISFLGVVNLFLAGIVLGIYYVHKSNLWLPIGMHLTWNFFQGPIFGFEVSGIKSQSLIKQTVNGSDLITGGKFGFEASLLATVLIVVVILYLDKNYREQK
ncbi:MAG: type II CAAX endopeptidase family protein [Candidatus Neomarinimicrobiota bacterium]|nr:type II CAAX endopeptidase family protein [Candidatus Neomarinimicrobiota bacterium]|tara:strand:+ start:430 stop:1308 length:879 start_codon:yes stop_codon:yes gene_type:complete